MKTCIGNVLSLVCCLFSLIACNAKSGPPDDVVKKEVAVLYANNSFSDKISIDNIQVIDRKVDATSAVIIVTVSITCKEEWAENSTFAIELAPLIGNISCQQSQRKNIEAKALFSKFDSGWRIEHWNPPY